MRGVGDEVCGVCGWGTGGGAVGIQGGEWV